MDLILKGRSIFGQATFVHLKYRRGVWYVLNIAPLEGGDFLDVLKLTPWRYFRGADFALHTGCRKSVEGKNMIEFRNDGGPKLAYNYNYRLLFINIAAYNML